MSVTRLLLLGMLLTLVGSSPWMTSLGDEGAGDARLSGDLTTGESQRGGFMTFQLSPLCMRALVSAAVACSQVGPAGLAGCGVALHLTQGSCP